MLRPKGLVLGPRTAPNSSAQYQKEGLAGIGKRATSPGVHPRPEVLLPWAEIDTRLIDTTFLAPALTAKVTQGARRGRIIEVPGDKDRYIDRCYIPGTSPDSQRNPRGQTGYKYGESRRYSQAGTHSKSRGSCQGPHAKEANKAG